MIYLIVISLFDRTGERAILHGGLLIVLVGFFILLPWGKKLPNIQWQGIIQVILTDHHNGFLKAFYCVFFLMACITFLQK